MLRRKIKSPALVFESSSLGRQTNTRIAIAYVKGIVNEEILQELKTRLARIDTGAILESGYIEEYIADHPLSVVPASAFPKSRTSWRQSCWKAGWPSSATARPMY
jgi:spore germination protein KA